MSRPVTCAVAILTGVLASGHARADWDTFDLGVTTADIDLAKAAGREQMDGAPVGTVNRWENPSTGAYGTVELVRIYERDGLPCRELYHVFYTETRGTNDFSSSICLFTDGSWKFDD